MTRSKSGQQCFCRRLLVPWPSVSVCLAFGAFCSVCNSHMVMRALGLTLSSGIFGQYMCCRPMCSQCVHRSVSVALWIELQFSGSWRSLPIPLPLFSILFIFYFFIYFFPPMPSGLSVTGACRGLGGGVRDLAAGWAGHSGVLAPWGCDCGCSPRASQAPSLHQRLGR